MNIDDIISGQEEEEEEEDTCIICHDELKPNERYKLDCSHDNIHEHVSKLTVIMTMLGGKEIMHKNAGSVTLELLN